MASRPPNDRDRTPRDRRQPEQPETPGIEPSLGSFISDSVRRSSARFRGEVEPERPARRRSEAASQAETERFGVPRRQRRVAPTEESAVVPAAPPPPDRPVWMREAIDRAGSPERAMAYAGGAVIALVLLIWLLASVMGGGGGGTPTATEDLQVLPIGQQGTPPSGPGRAIVTPTPSQQPTAPAPSRGSDNILQGLPPSSPAASTHPPTAFCQEPCLARVERTPTADQVLAASGTRPSYEGTDWYWVVADAKGIETISSQVETEVVRESAETIDLYMVVLPTPETDDEPAGLLGTVIDAVGTYRLVEAATVPAKVKPVTDWGLSVEKVAPAPPAAFARPDGRKQLTEPDIGGLMNDVDAGRMTQTVSDLQGMGSDGGTGVGTRFYPTRANQAAAEYLFRQLESYGLDVWYEDFISWDGYLLVNVVGEVKGNDPSRLYGVMAHFDTISKADPTHVAPGADDNATGVASGLEIARILAGWDLKYSFRVIFVNYEEQGVVGSQEWAKDAVAKGDPWEGVFNIDSVGSSRHGNQIVLNSAGESVWMEDLIRRVNDAYGVGEKLKIVQDKDIVADDNRLRDNGIEAVMVARELYGWSPVHHTPNDLKENVSIPHAQNCAVLILLSVASLLI